MLSSLPPELLSNIAKQLPDDGGCSLTNFRQTCSAFKNATVKPPCKKRVHYTKTCTLIESVWDDPDFKNNKLKLWKYAIKNDDIEVLEWMIHRTPFVEPSNILTSIAAEYNSLKVLQWLYRHGCQLDSNCYVEAICHKNNDMVVWLGKQGIACYGVRN